MKLADLRHRVALQQPVRTSDGAGGASAAWQTIAHTWAAITPLKGNEPLSAEKLSARLTHKAVMRWRPDLEPQMRLAAGARILNITSVQDPDGRRRWLVCICTEDVDP